MNTSAGAEEEVGTCNREPRLPRAPGAESPGIKKGGSLFLINQPYISIKEFKFIHINNSCIYYATHSEHRVHISLSLSHSNSSASVIIPVLLGENDTKSEMLVH